jgi:hypothetical protein
MKPDPTTEHIIDAEDIIARIEAIEKLVQIKEPLFVATVNQRGQIVIRDDVRKRNVIVPGDKVAVYHIEKVYE